MKIQKKKQIILAMKFSQGGTKLHFETSGGLSSRPPCLRACVQDELINTFLFEAPKLLLFPACPIGNFIFRYGCHIHPAWLPSCLLKAGFVTGYNAKLQPTIANIYYDVVLQATMLTNAENELFM